MNSCGVEEISEQLDENSVEIIEGKNNKVIIVHVAGAVQKEGIFELNENSRVADAIEKAGGLKPEADIGKINLAYKLEDGIKIFIPSKGEKIEENQSKDETEKYITKTEEKSHDIAKVNPKVNINTASQTELETIPGIGPSTALKIIKYREENKKFKSIEEIKEVGGIGESKFNAIKERITVK